MFAKIRADSRSKMENADKQCDTCQEQARKIPGIIKVDFAGVFADTDKYLGNSNVYIYKDHQSVESSMMVDIKGKVFMLHATTAYNTDADTKWTQDFLKQWVGQVIEKNP